MTSGLWMRAGSCPKSCQEPKPGQCVVARAQARDKAALPGTHSLAAHMWARISFPHTVPAALGAAQMQPGANLPLPLMWLGWPQGCKAVSPRLTGTHEYLQAGLAGPCAGLREAPVLGGSCRVSRVGGSGKWDGLLCSCPQQGCSLVIRIVPQLSSTAGSLSPSSHFPPPSPLSAG